MRSLAARLVTAWLRPCVRIDARAIRAIRSSHPRDRTRSSWIAVLGSLLLTCTPMWADSAGSVVGRTDTAMSTSSEERPLSVAVESARYGSIAVRTVPGAPCTLWIEVDPGEFGDGPPTTLNGVAEVDGSLMWTYPAPLVPSGLGRHHVRCRDGARSAEVTAGFPVSLAALDPREFRVRISTVEFGSEMAGVEVRSDPSLVPARDAAVAKLEASLESAWSAATRGLGSVRVIDASADIVIDVIAGHGYVEHHTAADGTRRIVMPLVDDAGPIWPWLVISAALHELGHIWCCYGAEAGAEGHWREKVADPRMALVNRFGLMNEGLRCQISLDGATRRCPDRFSDRELLAMGFRRIPAPLEDPCIAERRGLEERIDALDAALDVAEADMDARRAELRRLAPPREAPRTQLVAPDAPRRTLAPDSRYEVLRAELAAMVAAHREQVDVRNALSARLRALPC